LKSKSFLVLLMGLLLVFALAMLPCMSACTTEDGGDGGNGEVPTAIRMGLSTPLSGDAAAWGLAQLRAVELLADEYNAEGGIYIEAAGAKLPIEVIAYDDKYTPSETAICASRLIEQDEVQFIHNMGEEMATTVAPMAREAGIIQWGTSWELTDPNPDFPLSFSDLMRNQEMYGALVAYFHQQHPEVTNIGSWALNNAGGLLEHSIIQASAADYGMEVIFWDVFDWGTTDFTPIILPALDAGVEVFFSSSAPPDAVGNFIKQARDLGFDGYFCVTASETYYIAEIAGAENAEGLLSVGEIGEPIPAAAQKYADAYLAKYGPPLSTMCLIPWLQGSEPLFEAIERTQSLDAEVIAEELRTGTFSTVGGNCWFGGADFYGIDNQIQMPMPVSVCMDGIPVTVDWVDAAPYPDVNPAYE
jgi:branched-chain amino acid transport system substrate-binding protein